MKNTLMMCFGRKSAVFGSDDLPDIFIGGEFTDAELMEYGSGGQLLALNDLITQYGPNIQDAFSQIPDAKAMSTSADGNIYAAAADQPGSPGSAFALLDQHHMA
ncbi:MAG: hypothetical protein ACLR23_18150 [Clostridia bacterium]